MKHFLADKSYENLYIVAGDNDLIWYLLNRWNKYTVGWTTQIIEDNKYHSEQLGRYYSQYVFTNYSFSEITGKFTLTQPQLIRNLYDSDFDKQTAEWVYYGTSSDVTGSIYTSSSEIIEGSAIYTFDIEWYFQNGSPQSNNSLLAQVSRQRINGEYCYGLKAVEDPTKKGDLLGTVYNKDSSTYPANGTKDGFFYENTTPVMPELWPVT